MRTAQIKNIATIIFLGALGSGLWSIAGDPFMNWCVDTFILIAKTVNDGYYDLLHEEIGKGLHEGSALFLRGMFYLIITLLIITPPILSFIIYKRFYSLRSETENKANKIPKKTQLKLYFIFTLAYAIIAVPFFISRIIITEYTNSGIVFVERSIEILSPVLDNKEILHFRADYRSVKDANTFYKLYDNLQSVAKEQSIEIPEFNIAR